MVMFSQALYLKRNRKNDEGWGKKNINNAMFMKLYRIIWASWLAKWLKTKNG